MNPLVKFLEDNIGGNLDALGHGDAFLAITADTIHEIYNQ